MHDITLLFLEVGVILNSVTIITLAIMLKKQMVEQKKINSRMEIMISDNQKYKTFANDCYKNFRYVKAGFREIRRELIENGFLDLKYEYLHEGEATEELIDKFMKEE